jgi:hypothetical protein
VTDVTQWEIPTDDTKPSISPRSARADEGTEEDDKVGADYAAAGKRKNRQVIMAESYDPSAGSKVEIKKIDKPSKIKCVRICSLS